MNVLLTKELERIENEIDITEYQFQKIVKTFETDMKNKKMLKMLHTYVFPKFDVTPGEYLAVDFGGTNVRAVLYEVTDKNKINVKVNTSFKLKDEKHDFTSNKYTLADVFDFVAKEIGKIIDKDKEYLLGHTFSFPTEFRAKNEAILLDFSKGFDIREAIGNDVNKTFYEALKKRTLKVTPVNIINDTVATLLTGKFYYKNVDIAVITGTGHNICYENSEGELINVEAGAFSKDLPLSFYDLMHFEENKKIRNNVMELLTGGKYIGKTADYIIKDFNELGVLKCENEVDGRTLTLALIDELDGSFNKETKEALKYIAKILLRRAAKLVVAEIVAILNELDSELKTSHTIIFDGSVYEKNEYFKECITKYIDDHYGSKSQKIKHVFVKDASNIGALLSIFV